MDNNDDIADYIGLDHRLALVASPNSFALVITDESMLPILKLNDIVIIDPDIKPQPGEIVAARIATEEQVILRKYRPLLTPTNDTIEHISFELIALNEDWPRILIDVPSKGFIIGTLIEHRCRRRIIFPKEQP